MKNGLRKALCILSAFCIIFSMTGCIDVSRLLNKTKDLDDLRAEIAKGDFVEEWTGDIPEGKKVKYVPVSECYVGIDYYRTDRLYEYDSYGNLTLEIEKNRNAEIRREITYNDGGLITSKKQEYKGEFGSANPRLEYDCEYEYNGKGYLICYRIKVLGKVHEYGYEYNEEGHLISSINRDNGETTKYPADPPGTKTCVKLDPSFDLPDPEVVKITYGDNGEVISEVIGSKTTTYEYSGGQMTGYSTDNGYTVTNFDAEGRKLKSVSKNTGSTDEYTYNEYGDPVLSTTTSKGELTQKTEYVYTYDSSGNMTSKTTKIWRKTYKGEEKNAGSVITYTYAGHNLPVTEEAKNLEGKFSHLKAVYYKAVLVPE